MDPISFALSVLTAYKEVYLTARFVYTTILSTKEYREEQEDLLKDFYDEVLYLQSFGRIFAQRNGRVVQDPGLDAVSLEEFNNRPMTADEH